jgi:hypothetical protein
MEEPRTLAPAHLLYTHTHMYSRMCSHTHYHAHTIHSHMHTYAFTHSFTHIHTHSHTLSHSHFRNRSVKEKHVGLLPVSNYPFKYIENIFWPLTATFLMSHRMTELALVSEVIIYSFTVFLLLIAEIIVASRWTGCWHHFCLIWIFSTFQLELFIWMIKFVVITNFGFGWVF